MFVRKSVGADFAAILAIVNDAARVYRGVIPADRWHEPYMSTDGATWAIDFYRRNGVTLLARGDKDRLLQKYWSIPARQIETSVVLADGRWMETEQLK